jgi:hypothetical protein
MTIHFVKDWKIKNNYKCVLTPDGRHFVRFWASRRTSRWSAWDSVPTCGRTR